MINQSYIHSCVAILLLEVGGCGCARFVNEYRMGLKKKTNERRGRSEHRRNSLEEGPGTKSKVRKLVRRKNKGKEGQSDSKRRKPRTKLR